MGVTFQKQLRHEITQRLLSRSVSSLFKHSIISNIQSFGDHAKDRNSMNSSFFGCQTFRRSWWLSRRGFAVAACAAVWRKPPAASTSKRTISTGGETYIIDDKSLISDFHPPTSTSRTIQLKSRLLTHSAHVRQNHVFCQHQCMCTINHVSPLSVHVHPFVLFCRITCWLPAISCCFQPFMSRPGQLLK